MVTALTRAQVRRYRAHAQQLGRPAGGPADLAGTAVLDLGVQDTGPDGARWALAVRGVDVAALGEDDLVLVWSLRGAPHAYRRGDLPAVAAAVAPFSEADAAKRVLNAAKPLRAAGIDVLTALDTLASAMASVVQGPVVKGEVSARVTAAVPAPHLRYCGPCGATHPYELPFRLAALRAGLELVPGTSPPVLRPALPSGTGPDAPAERLDVVRAFLRLLGPATPQQVAGHLDAPVADVRARWPQEAVAVRVDGENRWVLAADEDDLVAAQAPGVHLLGPFDPFLQARDRTTLVDDPARAKALWPVLGRPGAVLAGGDLVGTWRPRATGPRLRVAVELWDGAPDPLRAAVAEEAERLAAFRGVQLAGVDITA